MSQTWRRSLADSVSSTRHARNVHSGKAGLRRLPPELQGTAAARDAARFLLLTPPLSLAARAPYGALTATAVAMLPLWARIPLLLPYFPPVELTVVRSVGRVLVGGLRWVLPAPESTLSSDR